MKESGPSDRAPVVSLAAYRERRAEDEVLELLCQCDRETGRAVLREYADAVEKLTLERGPSVKVVSDEG